MAVFGKKIWKIGDERRLHEQDALRHIQLEQTTGIVGIFYKQYINDSRKFALKFKGQRILDIGCGDGIILEDSGIGSLGIDISFNRCKRIKEKQKKSVCGSGFELPIKSNSVDCVLLIAILEHTSKPELVIDEVQRVLKKGGEVAILVPNDINMSIGRALLLKFPPLYPGHISFMTPKRIKKRLKGRFDITKEYNLPFHNLSFWLNLYNFIYLKKR